ncbi:MAG: hypothetical protein NC253_07540 [Ruminococcus sp.]|nr:hypothetical protein [Ruminococcus sp.]MCM1381716.1 hypothetical protein [Muribaculaceae bacterium]MCM1479595.1 hypothetical protein [Muribaculaceae bacterium]
MNVKKTIASIAAIAMVASATSLAPVFAGTSVAADDTAAVTPAADVETNENQPAAQADTVDVDDGDGDDGDSGDAPAGNTMPTVTTGSVNGGVSYLEEGESGSVNVAAKDGATNEYNVTVQLKKGENEAIDGGRHEQDNDANRKDYLLEIPIDGIDAATWSFADGSDYTADLGVMSNNVYDGKLGLWLPVGAANSQKTYKVILKKGDDTIVLNITSTNGTYTPAPVVTEPTAEEKVAAALDEVQTLIDGLDYSQMTAADAEADLLDKLSALGYEDIDVTYEFEPDENGNVTVKVYIVSKDDETVEELATKDLKVYVKPVEKEPEDETTTTADPIVYVPGSSTSSGSSEAAAEPTVEASPAAVSASKDKDVVIEATAPVTESVLEAFANNKSSETLTLKYSSALKVTINKSDVNGEAAANLDFSLSGKNFLSEKAIAKSAALSEATKVVQLDFVSEGDFGGVDKVTIKNRVGMQYVGQKVTVYEYVDGKLVKLGVAEVNGAGVVKFNIDHFGQFVLAVE